jgi:hypothetical protein
VNVLLIARHVHAQGFPGGDHRAPELGIHRVRCSRDPPRRSRTAAAAARESMARINGAPPSIAFA